MLSEVKKFFYTLAGVSISAGLLLTAQPLQAATSTWTGGTSGNWNVGANWSGGVVPTAADDVSISSVSYATITVPFGQVIAFHNLTLASSTLALYGDIGTGTNVVINGGGSIQQGNGNVQKLNGDLSILSTNQQTALSHVALPLSSTTPFVNFEAQNIFISTGTLIDVIGLGYAGGALNQDGSGPNPGHGGAAGGGGGGICGIGGNGAGGTGGLGGGTGVPAGFRTLMDYGSGGGGSATSSGGAGGGKIKLFARNTFIQNGSIYANGNPQSYMGSTNGGGGGSGGSIWVIAKNFIANAGGLTANGGVADGFTGGGGGGGGCVRLEFFVTSTQGELNVDTYGMVRGGIGTLSGTTGTYRVFKAPAPVANLVAATGTNPYTNANLSWSWGGGSFDNFYSIDRFVNGEVVASTVTTSVATTTLSFIDSGLTPANWYRYRFYVTSSTVPAFTIVAGGGVAESLTTSDYEYADRIIVPQLLSATVGGVTTTTLPVALNYGLNPSTTTLLVSDNYGYFYDTSGQRSGTSPNYLTVGGWQGSFPALSPSTSYTFTFTPYTAVGTTTYTYYAPTSSLVITTTTPLSLPTPPVFSGESSSTINLTWSQNSNPSTTPYAVYNQTLNKYHTVSGTLSNTPVYFPFASWGGAARELSAGTLYNFQIILRNESGTIVATSTAAGSYTLNADGTAFSSGGGTPYVPTSNSSTTATSGSGWYFGTPGNPLVTTSPSSTPVTSGTVTATSSLVFYRLPDGTLITPQSVFGGLVFTGGVTAFPLYQGKNASSHILFARLPTSTSALKLPTTLAFRYSFENVGIRRTYRVERVLLQGSKILYRSTASRVIATGETVRYSPSQSLVRTLVSGRYTMRVRITSLDGKTIYDENTFDLEVVK